MKFRLTADTTFDAVDLDDALNKLAAHFMEVLTEGDSSLEHIGAIEIKATGGEA